MDPKEIHSNPFAGNNNQTITLFFTNLQHAAGNQLRTAKTTKKPAKEV